VGFEKKKREERTRERVNGQRIVVVKVRGGVGGRLFLRTELWNNNIPYRQNNIPYRQNLAQ
jgi:hypothetical protein